MKKFYGFIGVSRLLFFLMGCGGAVSESNTATVVFKNVATDISVIANWNNQKIGPINPNGSSSVTADIGDNTMQWQDKDGKNLTTTSILKVEGGHTYTYTYDPADYLGGDTNDGSCEYYYSLFRCGDVVNGIEYVGGLVPDECQCPIGIATQTGVDNVSDGGPWNICSCL